MTTITYSYIETNTGMQRFGQCNNLTKAAAVALAVERLDAIELANGDYLYWPDETPGQAFVADTDELATFGAACHHGRAQEAYSIWCAETGREATEAEMNEVAS